MPLKKNEHLCLQCDGAGTRPNKGVDWELLLCKGCNGHGVIVFDKYQKKVVKFDVDSKVATKATIGR